MRCISVNKNQSVAAAFRGCSLRGDDISKSPCALHAQGQALCHCQVVVSVLQHQYSNLNTCQPTFSVDYKLIFICF